MSTSDIIQIILIFLTILGLFFSYYYNNKQLNLFTTQLKLNFFNEYTKRYQEIILNFPENINSENFDFNQLTKSERNKTLRYMRAYFDLCSEEYNLHKRELIDDEIWKNWEAGIRFAFTKKAFKDGWKIIQTDTIYYDDFYYWVENEILNKKEKSS
jgi:hypothetical protein